MGRQVNFFVLPDDLAAIEAAIRKTGDMCFLSDRTSMAEPAELDTLALDTAGVGSLRAHVARHQDLGSVVGRLAARWLAPVHADRSGLDSITRCSQRQD